MLGGFWRVCVKGPVLVSLLAALGLFCGVVGVVRAQTAPPTPLTHWVTDPQHVLGADDAAALAQRLQDLAQTLPGNPQIVVDIPDQVDDIDSYANTVFHATGLGRKGADNGVLIVLAIAQRQSRIEVGYGLEGVLTDLQSSDILRASRPALQAGHYAAALNGIVDGVAGLLKNADADTSPSQPVVDAQTDALEGVGGVVVAVLLLVVLPYFLFRRAARRSAQNLGYMAPQMQDTSMGWAFWLNLVLNILAVFLQGRGGGMGGGSGGFRSGGGDSGGGGARDNW